MVSASALRLAAGGSSNAIGAVTTALRNMDSVNLSAIMRSVDADTAASVIRAMPAEDAARIVSRLDDATLSALRANPDFARAFPAGGVSDTATTAARSSRSTVSPQVTKTAFDAMDAVPDVVKNNAKRTYPKGVDGQKKIVADVTDVADDKVFDATRNLGMTDETAEATADATSAALKGSDEAIEACEKVGFIKKSWGNVANFTKKHWLKIGLGAVLLCMMYDTSNPFKALERALDDAKETVKGLKGVADSAAKAAKKAAEGTFDFLAFFFQYWWVSGICCCVLVIMIAIMATVGGGGGGGGGRYSRRFY